LPNATSYRANDADAARIVGAIAGWRAEEVPLDRLWPLVAHDALALAEQERQLDRLRAANRQATLAVDRAEALQAATQAALLRQTEFLAILAHELRGPLASIRCAAEAMGALNLDEAQIARIHIIIERQTEHASRLIEDLLDLSRARSGKLRLVFGAVDMRELIDAAVEACRPAMDRRGQRFCLDVEVCDPCLRGDAVRLAQVLANLLENASKYTPEHGQVGLHARTDDGFMVLTVSDSGIGMSPDALPSIFDSFAQQPGAVLFSGNGLGIGLAVVRELVLAHGGSVTARSAGAGQGSQFVVRLPLSR
jgi:signal transduction histidine kinase